MSAELVQVTQPVSDAELEQYKTTVRQIVKTEFVPTAYRNKPYQCLAAMLYGREIGLAPMASLSEIYMVDGRPTLSAKAMVQLARQRGHSISGESTPEKAVVHGTRGDNGDAMRVTFTMEQAKKIVRKGKPLVDGDNWRNYPDDMLWARAVSRLCRRLFPDVLGAMPYSPEEIPEPEPEDRMERALSQLPKDDSVKVEEGFDEFAQAEDADWADVDEGSRASGEAGGAAEPSGAGPDAPPANEPEPSFEEKATAAQRRKIEREGGQLPL